MEINNNILVETLTRGRDSAKRLQDLLCRNEKEDSVSVDDLVTAISDSFASGLLMLKPCGSVDRPLEPLTDVEMIQPPLVIQGRGRYKRKTMDSRVEFSDTSEDAYQWRKYGHKNIQNSKFPRCYFRCTYKDGHGCMASKHVQQLGVESNKFCITYFGHHTCPTTLHTVSHSGPGVVLDFGSFKDHGYLTSSPSTTNNIHNKSPRKQKNLSNKVSLANDARLSTTLASSDLMINDFNSCNAAMGSEQGGSSSSVTSHDFLGKDFFENDDFFNDVLIDDVLLILESL